jgi:hypothetical protein
MMTTRKIIKKTEAVKIAKANKWDAEETEYFLNSCDWFNKEHDAQANFTIKERNAVAVYLISKEVNERSSGFGQSKDARYICKGLDDIMGLQFGTCEAIARSEAARQGRALITELNMGLDHITLTNNNPYFKSTIQAI